MLVLAIVAITIAASGVRGGELTLTLAALAAIVAGWWTLGVRAAASRGQRLAVSYLVIMIAAIFVIVSVTPFGGLLLFVAYSHIWYLNENRWLGSALVLLLSSAFAGAMIGRLGLGGGEVVPVLAEVAVITVFALFMGWWVWHVVMGSQRRAWLLAQLERAQAALAEANRAEGVRSERERVAREIHDTLAQGFGSVVLLAQAARSDLERGDVESANARIDLVEATGRSNLAEARALVAAYRPADLDGHGLAAALARVGERVAAQSGIAIEVDAGADLAAISREEEVILLRAAQEGLANVAKHSRAVGAVVRLTRDSDPHEVPRPASRAVLTIADDGVGPVEAAIAGDSGVEAYGLRGMRERVGAAGGAVTLTRRERGGAELRVVLPLSHESQPGATSPAAVSGAQP